MSNLTLIERVRVMQLAVAQARRNGVASLLASPLLRWRYGAPTAEALAMVPQELRPADPSFIHEISEGQFGLANSPAFVGTGTPYDITPPSEAWARELHGFGWLRHLNAAASEEATAKALALVQEWIGYGEARHDVAWEPDVVGRRIISWICNSGMLLEGVGQATFDRTAASLVDQLIGLSAAWSSAPDGYPRLAALIGVVYGDLCILGHERHLAVSEAKLGSELSRQIFPDGGHISRNAEVPLALLLDLLPLRQCFATRKRELPAEIDRAISHMLAFLRFMRLGDSTLARFNGVGATAMAELSSVLAYDAERSSLPAEAPQSRYVRLEMDSLVLIADAGDIPPFLHAGHAHAGALSFELSDGACAMFLNCGTPGVAEVHHAGSARATSSHNTLGLGGRSSARLLKDDRLERLVGGAPLRTLGHTTAKVETGDDGATLTMTSDGYVQEHGLVHTRILRIARDGSRLAGVDRLAGQTQSYRLKHDVPFAIRFHLAPDVECEAAEAGAITLALPDGGAWSFAADGAEISVEPSIHYADSSGAVRTRQLVLRGACWGESEVAWRVERKL